MGGAWAAVQRRWWHASRPGGRPGARATPSALALAALVLAALPPMLAPAMAPAAAVGEVVISEFRTRGPNGPSDEFVELYNRSDGPVDIGGWKLSASSGTGAIRLRATIAAGTVLQPGQYFLLTNASPNGYSGPVPGDQSYATGIADDGGIALLRPDDTVADQVGLGAGAAYQEGTPLPRLAGRFDQSYERRPGGPAGNAWDGDDNAGDFLLNSCGANPQNSASVLVPPSSATAGGVAPGGADFVAQPILPIGALQGRVDAADAGERHRSPCVLAGGQGPLVTLQGVIHQWMLARTRTGEPVYGAFLQNAAVVADGDPDTSDGLLVILDANGAFPPPRDGGVPPGVGDEVLLQGRLAERDGLTRLTAPTVLSVVRRALDLDLVVPAFDADPPADRAAAARYWERHEGMRARVPAGSSVLAPRYVADDASADAEVWVARVDGTYGQRPDPYARRDFRHPHPLETLDGPPYEEGAADRIVLGSHGIKAATGDAGAVLAPVRTFDVLASAATGAVSYWRGAYQVQVAAPLTLAPGAEPAQNAPPEAPDRSREFSVASYNLANLYDFRDDPFDPCDFAGNAGCRAGDPDFGWVPGSEAAYQARLRLLAAQIVHDLHAPDVVLLQEVEDQDICVVEAGALVCGVTDDADGEPDTAQDLARAIATLGGPIYRAANDRDGADTRGIVAAFLYRTDRVELLVPDAADPVLGSAPVVTGYPGPGVPENAQVQNPKALNARRPGPDDAPPEDESSPARVFTRGPQVALFRVWRDAVGAGPAVDLYAINNHFTSRRDRRPWVRREQARYVAALVAALRGADPAVPVLVGGDLNAFPCPPDPAACETDELGPLYGADLISLWSDHLLAAAPASAYSYVFRGRAQTLDHLFVSAPLRALLVAMRHAHINADWPGDAAAAAPRAVSDHDPPVARFAFPAP